MLQSAVQEKQQNRTSHETMITIRYTRGQGHAKKSNQSTTLRSRKEIFTKEILPAF